VTRHLLFVLMMAWPLAAPAQEVIGTIGGNLQGRPANWFVTASAEGGQSDWIGDETYAQVTILGHATVNTVLETTGALMLSFEMVQEAGGYNVLGRDITYYRRPDKAYVSGENEAEIQVTHVEFDDGLLTLSGKFAGTLSVTDETTDTRVVSGSFDASLLILE
jgi:uncharacterized protein (UPF0297 family)